jgi:hypothetical protein
MQKRFLCVPENFVMGPTNDTVRWEVQHLMQDANTNYPHARV